MTQSSSVVMYRSPWFRAAKAVLIRAEQTLPRSMYNGIYGASFSLYRTGLEASYHRQQRRLKRSGDLEGVRRGEAVIKAMPYSLVGPSGLQATYEAVRDAIRRGVPGAIVECGIAGGGSSAVMALALRDAGERRHLWLFDSYEGLPDPTVDDIDPASGGTGAHIRPLPRGSCLGTFEEVEHLMVDVIGVPRDQFTMVKGWFQDSVGPNAETVGEIAVLRLDGDWYESTRTCLDGLYSRLAPGGLLIVDDYHSCFGSYRALNEFLSEQGDSDPAFVNDGSGGVLYVRPGPTA
jgi:O-methyltransferase